MLVAGWRHALRRAWPYIIIIIITGVCLWAVHGATELRVFTVVEFCAAWNGGGVL